MIIALSDAHIEDIVIIVCITLGYIAYRLTGGG